MRNILPNALLGLAIADLLAAFMAGMAANISAFNTVFSYDVWQRYIRKDHSDDYYLRIGRIATVGATFIAIFTAVIASSFSNIMDHLQSLFGFFNAPLFATFILGMFWKRMTATAGWVGLSAGPLWDHPHPDGHLRRQGLREDGRDQRQPLGGARPARHDRHLHPVGATQADPRARARGATGRRRHAPCAETAPVRPLNGAAAAAGRPGRRTTSGS